MPDNSSDAPITGRAPAQPLPRAPFRGRVPTIDVRTLAGLLENDSSITLIDVREPVEWAFARLPGATHIPLGRVPEAIAGGEIPSDAEVVVYCHHGVRSEMAARALLGSGFSRVRNLTGGIDAWSLEIDPSVPRY